MKRFCIKVFFLAFGLFVVSISADFIISRFLQESKDFKYVVWNDIIKGNMHNDIIIMGSSRAFVHISPSIIDSTLGTSTYNIAMDGSRIERQIPRYNLYRLYNKKPKVILQNVD